MFVDGFGLFEVCLGLNGKGTNFLLIISDLTWGYGSVMPTLCPAWMLKGRALPLQLRLHQPNLWQDCIGLAELTNSGNNNGCH